MKQPSPFTQKTAMGGTDGVDRQPMRQAPRHELRPIEDYVEFEEENRLRIPREMWPDGFVLQWVTDTVFGRPEKQHRARFERTGWKSVLCEDEIGERFAGMFMPEGATGEINMDGLVLMARPKTFNDRSRALQNTRARERVQIKERQMLGGDLGAKVTLSPQHPTAVRSNTITRSIDTIQIPVPTE